jgi:hypothetical protein
MATASVISRLSQAVDQIEERRRQNRPWKIARFVVVMTRTRMWRRLATSRPTLRIGTRTS